MSTKTADNRIDAEYLTDKFNGRHLTYSSDSPDKPRFPDELLRTYRAIRWLERAEKEKDDPDAAFIFYWIAFNAAYARNLPGSQFDEASEFQTFIRKVDMADRQNIIEDYVILKIPKTIVSLVANQFVFRDFWRHHNGDSNASNWRRKLEESIRHTGYQLGRGEAVEVLTTLLDRLYVLRNQLVHGGATWNSSVNRRQVEDGAEIMGFLVPVLIDLMIDNAALFDGPPHYPPIPG